MMMPNAFFKKIEISNTIGDRKTSYDNPHVNESLEINAQYDDFGNRVYKYSDLFGNRVYRDAVSSKTEQNSIFSSHMDVTVTAEIDLTRDVAAPIGPDAEVYRRLDVLSDAINTDIYADGGILKYLSAAVIQVKDDLSLTTILENLKTAVWSMADLRNLNARNAISMIEIKITDYSQKYINHTFNIKETPVNELSYIIFVDLDLTQIGMDYDIPDEILKDIKAKYEISPRVMTVFKGGKLNTNIMVFYNIDRQTGEITPYTNTAVFKVGDYYYDSNNNQLVAQVASNDVIADSRVIAPADYLENDNQNYEYLFDSFSKRKKISHLEPVYQVTRPVFSENYITSDKDGYARGAFVFNKRLAVMLNSKYGWLLKSEEQSIIDEIMEYSEVVEMKLYRKRVRKFDTVNGLNTKIESYEFADDYNDIYLLRGDNKKFFRIVRGKLAGVGMPTYTYHDPHSSGITDGHYQYEAHATIKDGCVEFLKRKYLLLDLITSKIYELLLESEQDYTYDGFFSDSFKKYLLKFYIKHNIKEEYFAVELIDIASIFCNLDPSLYNLLKGYTSFQSGGPKTLRYVYEFCNRILNYFNEIMPTHKYSVDMTNLSAGGFKENDICIKEDLRGIFDSNIKKNDGLDFIEFGEGDGKITEYVDSTGLMVIDGLDYQRRSTFESLKYFDNPDAGGFYTVGANGVSVSNITENSYGFLTPVVLGSDQLNQLAGMMNTDDGRREAETSVAARYNVQNSDTSQTGDIPVNDLSTVNLDEFQLADITSADINFDTTTINTVNSQLTPLTETATPAQSSVENGWFLEPIMSVSTVNPLLAVVNSSNMSNEAPQLQSLYALGSFDPNASMLKLNELNQVDEYHFIYNYQLIGKVEFLSGFENSLEDGVELMSAPKWRLLTKTIFDNLRDETICRMRMYSSPLMLIKNTSEPHIYNKYFIIRRNPAREIRLGVREEIRANANGIPNAPLDPSILGAFLIK